MKSVFFVTFFLMACHMQTYCQRASRRPQSTSLFTSSVPFSGRLFNATLTNDGKDSILLKLGPYNRIDRNDTLNLLRTSHCDYSTIGEHYDLDNNSEQIGCVNWYTLQLIKPRETIQFLLRMGDFDQTDTAHLYFFFTKSFTKLDRELELYSNPQKIFMMKESRKFLSGYVVVEKSNPNIILAICGDDDKNLIGFAAVEEGDVCADATKTK